MISSLTFSELWVVSMEHLQLVWHASRERLPFRTPGSIPLFGTYVCSNCWDQIPRTCVYSTFNLDYPWNFLDFAHFILIDYIYFVSYRRQKRSTEGCSKFKSPETRQVQERLVSTLEHMQVPNFKIDAVQIMSTVEVGDCFNLVMTYIL